MDRSTRTITVHDRPQLAERMKVYARNFALSSLVSAVASLCMGIGIALGQSRLSNFIMAAASAVLLVSLIFDYKAIASLVKERSSAEIVRPPGSALLSCVKFFYTHKTITQVFEPLLADWRKEYFDAIQADELWKARWISLSYTFRALQTMGLTNIVKYPVTKLLDRLTRNLF